MIYLDNAATSWPKPPEVIDAWIQYHRDVAGSPGRGAHRGTVEAGRRVESVRRSLASFLGSDRPESLIFTPSCTAALNLALRGVLRPGDHAVATALDHNSVLRPLAAMREEGRIEFTIAPATADGFVFPESVRAAMRPNTKLVAATHASNLLGTVQDVGAFAKIAHDAGAMFLLDAAQSAGRLPVDQTRLGADLIAIPSHKGLLGPAGAGALLARPGVALSPLLHGGTGIDSASLTPAIVWPQSFEPGTANAAGIVSWGAGLEHVAERGVHAILEHERRLVQTFEAMLGDLDGVILHGCRDVERRVGVVALSLRACPAADAAAILDASFDIRVRAGHACAPMVAGACGAPADGFVRFSFGPSTTRDEVVAAANAVRAVAEGA